MSQKKNKQDIEIEEILSTIEDEAAAAINAENEGGDVENEDSAEPASSELDENQRLTNEVETLKDKNIRLLAEFDNFKKRTAGEYARMVDSANKNLMGDLIEVRESFSRALATPGDDYENFKAGIDQLFRKFDDQLTRHGLTSFGEPGDEFNPSLHDAMMKMPHEEIPADHIAQVFERGYKLKENIIRHAKVVVSDGSAA